jgi:hypothetical protein
VLRRSGALHVSWWSRRSVAGRSAAPEGLPLAFFAPRSDDDGLRPVVVFGDACPNSCLKGQLFTAPAATSRLPFPSCPQKAQTPDSPNVKLEENYFIE